MTFSKWMAACCLAAFSFSALPAMAAPADAAASAWTKEDVQKFCDFRWSAKPERHKKCMENHTKKIGQAKNAKELKVFAHMDNAKPKAPDAKKTAVQ